MVLRLIRRLSKWLAHSPGLPVLVALGLILLNFLLQLLPDRAIVGWLVQTDLFLHLGLLLGFLAILLGDAL